LKEIRWIDRQALILLQAESVAEHGGLEGLRDGGLLDSALACPINLNGYEGVADLARLAAAYAYGIVRNHPFVDGNKRAAFLAVGLFLALNGYRLDVDKVEATQIMLSLAAGDFGEVDFAMWLDNHLTSSRP
jgi:death on curing protein